MIDYKKIVKSSLLFQMKEKQMFCMNNGISGALIAIVLFLQLGNAGTVTFGLRLRRASPGKP